MHPYSYESNNDIRRRLSTEKFFRLLDAQKKEMTATMAQFDHDRHVLRIEDDSYGFLTVRIRLRKTGQTLHLVRFRKQPKLGVVYTFRKADSLADLAIEQELLPALEAAASAHADTKAVKAT